MTSTATGRISSRTEKPPEKEDEPGSQLSQKTKIATRKVAEANSGTEVVSTEATVMERSRRPPSAIPERTPRMREMILVRTNTLPPRIAVLASRGARNSRTGRLNCAEIFQSPVMKPRSQPKYRVTIGLL